MSDGEIALVLEFGGGTELLTSTKKTKKHSLRLPSRVSPHELRAASAAIAPATPSAANGHLPEKDGQPHENGASGPSSQKRPTKMRDLIEYVCRDIVTERHGMLVEQDGSIRPGILVLINDADWELEGEMDYELQNGDHICLISTLHGG